MAQTMGQASMHMCFNGGAYGNNPEYLGLVFINPQDGSSSIPLKALILLGSGAKPAIGVSTLEAQAVAILVKGLLTPQHKLKELPLASQVKRKNETSDNIKKKVLRPDRGGVSGC